MLRLFLLSYTLLPFGFCLNDTTLLSFQIRSNNEGKSGKNSKVNNPPSDSDNDKSKDDSKPRSKSRPARRIRCKSKKEAYERAKRAGKGAEPEHHPNDPHGPHYHPNVKNSQRTTPKGPCSHDHYFYPY